MVWCNHCCKTVPGIRPYGGALACNLCGRILENYNFSSTEVTFVKNAAGQCGSIATKLGSPRVMMHLASSDNAETREAALRELLELARERNDGSGCSSIEKDDEKLRQLLEERIKGISLMSQEDLETVKEERHLVDSLWSICYNEPSALREKGLFVLPGEDE